MFDATTAALVLEQLISDGYKDDGKVPPGYKFKVICLLAHRFVVHLTKKVHFVSS